MIFNLTVNESGGGSSPGTPGTYQVRVFYLSQNDSGHIFGPYSTREAAEACATVLAGRSDVSRAVVETL